VGRAVITAAATAAVARALLRFRWGAMVVMFGGVVGGSWAESR
jgi:hypothetical protein